MVMTVFFFFAQSWMAYKKQGVVGEAKKQEKQENPVRSQEAEKGASRKPRSCNPQKPRSQKAQRPKSCSAFIHEH